MFVNGSNFHPNLNRSKRVIKNKINKDNLNKFTFNIFSFLIKIGINKTNDTKINKIVGKIRFCRVTNKFSVEIIFPPKMNTNIHKEAKDKEKIIKTKKSNFLFFTLIK